MPRLTVKIPKYRLHKGTGQAVVTLDGRDHYLGKHGSPQSKARYNQLVGEWKLRGRVAPPGDSREFTVDELILAYLEHARSYYVKNGRPTGTQYVIKSALRPLHGMYGSRPCSEVGPLAIKSLREELIRRTTWSRVTINESVSVIRRMFKWGSENELVPVEFYHGQPVKDESEV